ncbi:MAG: gamma-glutamyl-gamma-aminobutyrate hydrolase family protein [Oscillospiraceae bacterium]|nr:gamma-glutamyl-gamma-aminobutyrate hydrolase family protein [Oscillospiraceae bacterium]
MDRPVIGITTEWDRDLGKYMLRDLYCDMVAAAGGEPVMLPYCCENISYLDGLLLSGGADIAAKLGGYEDGPMMRYDPPARDGCERRLFDKARACGMPILGICRGHQLVNCLLGGTMVRDLCEIGHDKDAHFKPEGNATHGMRTEEGSLLRSFYGETAHVTSVHHQALRTVGKGMRVTAWSDDGIIEGTEHESGKILTVQFHPERLGHLSTFRWLVGASKAAE